MLSNTKTRKESLNALDRVTGDISKCFPEEYMNSKLWRDRITVKFNLKV